MSCSGDGFLWKCRAERNWCSSRSDHEIETMTSNDVTKREHVEDEHKRTKHRTLGDPLGEKSRGGGAVVDVEELLSICEI